jgi:hypothetical protein
MSQKSSQSIQNFLMFQPRESRSGLRQKIFSKRSHSYSKSSRCYSPIIARNSHTNQQFRVRKCHSSDLIDVKNKVLYEHLVHSLALGQNGGKLLINGPNYLTRDQNSPRGYRRHLRDSVLLEQRRIERLRITELKSDQSSCKSNDTFIVNH